MPLPSIPSLDAEAQARAAARQAALTKPPGSLGRLEALSVQLAGMVGRLDWLPLRRVVVVCAGDHGVVAQGVSAYPQAVTGQMVANFLRGGAAVNVLARQMGARVTVVDAGVAVALEPHHALFDGRIAPGTADFTLGPAMTPEQASQSLALGLDVARGEINRGLDILCVGEMGIGNTTAASAIIAAITGQSPDDVTGRGTGIDDAQRTHKVRMIERALDVNAPADRGTLAKVGGFEIGAMAGLMIGAAASRVPVLLDGLMAYKGDFASGIRFWDSGYGGTKASDHYTATTYSYTGCDNIKPNLILFHFGTNELIAGVSASTFTANLKTLADHILALCPSPKPSIGVLLAWPTSGSDPTLTVANWAAYRAAARALCAANNYELLDFYDVIGDLGSTDPLDVAETDILHPNANGAHLYADEIMSTILR